MSIVNKLNRVLGPTFRAKISNTGKLVEKYATFYQTKSVQEGTILYESRDGQTLSDSPFAIFEYLMKEEVDTNYTHIWSVVPSEEMTVIMNKYRHDKNVHFVVRNSEEYLMWLASAEYLINNATFQSFVTIKEEQTYINTWHGTPLKTMGYDIPGNPGGAKNVVRNFFMADYLISPNAHTTNMFLDSYRLRHAYKGEVLESGYPRMDQTFKVDKREMMDELKEFGTEINQYKPTMLYTPTWKGTSISQSRDDIEQIITETNRLRDVFGMKYNVLIKVHPFLYQQAMSYPELKRHLIPDVIDTNKVLGITDLLITDYSSIFFDYLVTDKPILFYCWDDDLYSSQRGKYFEYDELPGPVSFTLEELITTIKDLEAQVAKRQPQYDRFKADFVSYDDGEATKRYVDYIFHRQPVASDKMTIHRQNTGKKDLLLYPGGLRNNGITSSFINLVNMIDYTQYNVTCFLDDIKTKEQIANLNRIPQQASLLFRFGMPLYQLKEANDDLKLHIKGVKHPNRYPQHVYEREVRRLLGKHHYDVAIDFSGYSLHWTKMVLGAQAKRHICYMHSDMASDLERTVNGRKIHKMNLTGLFSVYDRYDYLMSVSEITRDVNRENLKNYASEDKFVYALNTINPKKILEPMEAVVEVTEVQETEAFHREANLKPNASGYQLYNTRPDSPYAVAKEHRLEQSDVLVLGRYDYQGDTYFKIKQQGIYMGWIASKEVVIAPVRLLKEDRVNYFGKVRHTGGSMLYTGPIGLEESKELSSTYPLHNLYVTIIKKAETHEGTSLYVRWSNREMGWINANNFVASRKLDTKETDAMTLKKAGLRNVVKTADSVLKKGKKIRLTKVPTDRNIRDAYYYLVNGSTQQGYKSPNIYGEGEYLEDGELIYVDSEYQVDGHTWLHIDRSEGGKMWVLPHQLDLKELTEKGVFKRVSRRYPVCPMHSEMKVYASLDDIFRRDEGLLVKAIPHPIVTEEAVLTTGKTYVALEWENKTVWAESEEVSVDITKGVMNAKGEFIPYPQTDDTKFVTMGRLSEEKNQDLLIQSFAAFVKEQNQGYLYLIGSGPEEAALKERVQEEGLEDRVIFVGQVSQPFPYMAKCDCFVLTSNYEGQPMVLLEAMTLGLPIISTDIPSCRYVLENGTYGLLTETNDVSGIAESMKKLVKGKKTFKRFDPISYNQKALASLYKYLK